MNSSIINLTSVQCIRNLRLTRLDSNSIYLRWDHEEKFEKYIVKYRYITRPGDKALTTKKSAINFSRIRSNQKLEFSVQGITAKGNPGSIGKIFAHTRK